MLVILWHYNLTPLTQGAVLCTKELILEYIYESSDEQLMQI